MNHVPDPYLASLVAFAVSAVVTNAIHCVRRGGAPMVWQGPGVEWRAPARDSRSSGSIGFRGANFCHAEEHFRLPPRKNYTPHHYRSVYGGAGGYDDCLG